MKTVLRAVAAATLAGIVLAGVAQAAEPTIGGRLSAGGDHASLVNTGTEPVTVTMYTDGSFAVSPQSFQLEPGQTADMVLTGEPNGNLYANLTRVRGMAGDQPSLVLQVTLSPYVPPFPWHIPGGILFAVVTLAVVLRRLKPWQYRLTRSGGEQA